MNNFIKKRFALSEQGAKNFCKGMYWTVALDIVLMLPAVFVFLFLDDWLHPILTSQTTALHGVWYYCLLGLSFLAVMYIQPYFNTAVHTQASMRKAPIDAFRWQKNSGNYP